MIWEPEIDYSYPIYIQSVLADILQHTPVMGNHKYYCSTTLLMI